jgi:RNA polymerase sigma-70 factor (ECF subfamily)
MSDRHLDQLFARFQRKGDVGALAGVFDLAAPELLRVARHLARDEALAEDALQQTFLVAIEKRAEYDARARVLPWLLGILLRQVRQGQARAARVPDPERIEVRTADDPARVSAEREVDELVERGMAALPATYAGALRAYLRHGKSPAEIARGLGISANAASVRIHRGLALLRRSLPRGAAIGTAAALADARPVAPPLAAIRGQVLAQAGATVPPLTLASTGGGLVLGGLVMSKLTLVSALSILALATALAFAQRGRSEERGRLEAEIARLETLLAERTSPAAERPDGPGSGSTPLRTAAITPAAGTAAAGTTEEPPPVPVLDPQIWLRRFQQAATPREALSIARELAALDEDDSLAILREIFHDIPGASNRVQVLKPFVFDGGLGNAIEVLNLAATDPEQQVREAAWVHLVAYAFEDFNGAPAAYAAWYARFGGRPVPEVLQATTRELVLRLEACPDGELADLLQTLRRIDHRTGRRQGADVLALLKQAGLVAALERRIHSSGDERAVGQALHWLGDLDVEEDVLRRTALPVLQNLGRYPAGTRAAAFDALAREGRRWAVQPILDALMATPPENGTCFGAGMALAEIGDPAVIPTLIGMIVANDEYATRYGLGYFGLGKLTGVAYDESHDAAFWLQWWETNRGHLPPEVGTLSIPTIVLPVATR